jgi:hypothetical protein
MAQSGTKAAPKTTKECPICHTLGRGHRYGELGPAYGEWQFRPENAPCSLCEQELALMRARIADMDTAQAALQPVHLNRQFYFDLSGGVDFKLQERVKAALWSVLLALTTGTRSKSAGYFSQSGKTIVPDEGAAFCGYRERNRIECDAKMHPDALTAVQEFYELLPQITRDAYNAGKRDGQNILVALAQGQLPLNEYDRRILAER